MGGCGVPHGPANRLSRGDMCMALCQPSSPVPWQDSNEWAQGQVQGCSNRSSCDMGSVPPAFLSLSTEPHFRSGPAHTTGDPPPPSGGGCVGSKRLKLACESWRCHFSYVTLGASP